MAVAVTLLDSIIAMLLATGIALAIGDLPFLGPAYEDTSGKVDIHMQISWINLAISSGVLVLVGVLSGLVPALRASRLDPVESLRYE